MFSLVSQDARIIRTDEKHWAFRRVWILILIGLGLRIALAPIWMGYDTDVKTFMAWADHATAIGLPGLYGNPDYFMDYPPGYMYVLYVVGLVHKTLALQWGSGASLILFKLPAMLSDLVISYVLFTMAWGRASFNKLQCLGIAALYAFNPAVLVNSAIWGQVDAFFMIFVLWALLLQQKGRLVQASILLAVAILIKPQALLFGPFLLIDVLSRKDWKLFVKCVLSGALTMALVTLPFSLDKGYGWLFGLYFNTLASYPYASLNAYNLLTLLGGNFIKNSETVLGISYGLIGWVMMAASLFYCCYLFVKGKSKPGALLYIAFLFITAVFVCTTKMHERYLYYGLLLALASFLYIKDRRIMVLFLGFSLTNSINVADVWIHSMNQSYHIPRYDSLMLVVSAVNVLLLGYACWLGWKLFRIKSAPEAQSVMKNNSFFTKKDGWYLAGLVVLYTIIALYRLGGHEAPTTSWKPAVTGEAIIADLGAPHTINRINSFAGTGEGTYSYWFSTDKIEWKDQKTIKSDHTKVFTWVTEEPKLEARYVKIVADKPGFYLHEVGIFDANTDAPLAIQTLTPLESSSDTLGIPEHVFDEPEVVPYTPSFMEGSYFDEIYHARTAYEHLQKIEPYESTHPPLGKIFIAAGIWLFGLNPFGWRVVGTLFGVGMIPIMYFFARRLFGKSEYAFIAAFLMTFEFMHFAQTRIATIDVYGVFFIMLMFYFMYRYTTLSFYRDSLMKTLVPLSLSGLFFGIGAASKWIVIYGGLGLAVLLLFSLIERFVEYRKARRTLLGASGLNKSVVEVFPAAEEGSGIKSSSGASVRAETVSTVLSEAERGYLQRIVNRFPKYTILTLLWCIVMFVIVPAIIYFLSYIPFMMVPGPGHGWKDVITYQKHIYEYHRNLHAEHPFSSKWFEWPLMIRPIWYYQGHMLPEGKLSSIISFGNPLIWWPGFIAVLLSFYVAIRKKNRQLAVLLVAYCSQYLPWMLIPRLTFIYHYFAMVPFMILILTYFLKNFMEKRPANRKWGYIYLGAVLLMFIIFYPLLSGQVIPKDYSYWLRWLPGWNFF
ncbi:glycosyltransferase family 39 protein [Paenibacillus eucommiae]|uniref:Gpi18-like mannosyltransferase n=1 Tax=Paenibacillus eucommiae TaxID=1355755 RepID=A0ABS4J0Y8_9BACL|nr:glycosyltransferase family 39 protein [Paenibacillus eucommiae]MBP1993499.1 Gpi18-like mannosyltransferase [Paenibacillus eucommiae]